MNQCLNRWRSTFGLVLAIVALVPSFAIEADEPKSDKTASPPTRIEATQPESKETPATSKKRDTYPFRGKIASFDASALMLRLDGKTSKRVVHLTTQTRLTRSGQPALPEDLKPGEEVGGTLRKTPEGREEALLIRIGPKSDPTESDKDPTKLGNRTASTTPNP